MFNEIVTKEGLKFNDLEKKIYKFVCMLGCFIIKYVLESRDRKLMKARDTKKFRHKGYKNNCIKTIMGEVEYRRAVYLFEEDGEKKYVYLLDEDMRIETIGKVSINLAEKALSIAVNTTSYRKGEEEIKNTTNGTLSHEGLRRLVIETGNKIEQKENTEVELFDKEKLVKGTKEIVALFEEADGLWVNLQGKDRNEQIEKYKKQCEKKGKEFKKPKSVKTELKLHVTYEGWKKDDERHSLVNKSYIAGMMSSKKLEKIRNARLYQKYDLDKVKLRVMNGDGARWIKNITAKDAISQKDNFHIHQEIVRDIQDKKYREELEKIIEEKRFDEVEKYIESLKSELGGEEKTVKKLKKLQSYLKDGLPRYQDVLKERNQEMPKAPEGIEYRNPGIMESQIFTVLKVRLGSGRKSFCKQGASYLAKVCALKVEEKNQISLEKVEEPIKIDNSVEEWINAIEENIKNNKQHRANRKETEENIGATKNVLINARFMKEIMKERSFSQMGYII